jgi:threonyl-tRNA synthetase
MNDQPSPGLPASADARVGGRVEPLPADDHRRLGRELDLFASDPLLPAGMPIWLPAGAIVRGELERYIVEAERAAGYAHVYSPPLGKKSMYEISGHWEHYAEAMFPPIEDGGSGPIVLRPMNCPHHIVVYRSRPRSWRELPLRIAELGAMFRNEPSGSLSGLSRVRAMVLNDAHHFCDPADVAEEVALVVGLIEDAYAALGLSGHSYRLSLRGDGNKYVADEARWDRAEKMLAGALDDLGVAYEPVRGEGAFYGPKIDVQMSGRGRREESFSSVQLDFLLPQRFELGYAGPDGPRRPVMLHRTVLSSMERCLSFLLEQHAGNLPVWLAPVQAVALPVDPSSAAQARAVVEVVDAARAAGLRIDVDDAAEPLGARMRRARLARIPYRLVVGEREAAAGQVAVNLRDGRRLDPMPPRRFAALAAEIAAARRQQLWS